MATHILTVDETTFKTHLNYMFLGTGKNGAPHQGGALADILSIRPDDNIIFYVMKKGFFGIFKAKGNVFYDYKSYVGHDPQYLDDKLNGKTLTYRLMIEPKEVYQNYISEWDMMENPDNIKDYSIFNMQWSWIFKKLKGNRGCLSIDDTEFKLFEDNLKNNNNLLKNTSNYDYVNGQIKPLANNLIYDANCTSVIPKTPQKLNILNKEEDLRMLFTSESGNNHILDQVLNYKKNGLIKLISNEIACSFSERRMDLLLGTDKDKCLLIELKNHFVFNNSIYSQIKEYSRWISAYKLNYNEIIPILIIKAPREVAKTKRGKYYKFLSEEDKNNGKTSEWYNAIVSEVLKAKTDLANENIPKLSDLNVYIFSIDANNSLQNFKKIV